MSHTASVRVKYCFPSNMKITVLDVVQLYLNSGWNLNDGGHITLRPLGDKDEHDWIELGLHQTNELFEILEKKIAQKEDLGLVFRWSGGQHSVVATFFVQEKAITFLLIIYKIYHPELPKWTDVSWYMPKILNPLLKNDIPVESIEFIETV